MGDDFQSEVARMRAEMDQAMEGVKEVGRSVKVFYDALREQGFDETQAMRLTCEFVRGFSRSGDV